jgi:hypothetical protein
MLDNLNASRINVDVLNSVDTMLQQFSDYLPCIELNRFEALQTESELVERAKELHLNRMVIAGKSSSAMFNIVRCWCRLLGIVFSNLNSSNPNANFLPPHIHIKIRMDIDSVRTTEQLNSWLFFTGPENDYFREMQYLRGFIQLQDLIERAVIDLHFEDTGTMSTNPIVYMQMMPYPCYRGDPYVEYNVKHTKLQVISSCLEAKNQRMSTISFYLFLVHWCGQVCHWQIVLFSSMLLVIIDYLATLGVSIKNLMRERERNVEQVDIESTICLYGVVLTIIININVDNENHGFKFDIEFYFMVN